MPYAPISLGPRHKIRLENLTGADVFVVECRGCRRQWRVAPHRLHLDWRGHTRLLDLEPYLRCRRCEPRGEAVLVWRVERALPDG